MSPLLIKRASAKKPNSKPKKDFHQEADKKLVFGLVQKKIPNWTQLKYLSRYLSKREKTILRVVYILIVLCVVYLAVYGWQNLTTFYPDQGGEYTEGIVGSPKYINPLYASANEVDLDITKLVFSGLVKYDTQRQLVPELAKMWQVSEDQQEFTLTLRDNLKWSNGEPLNIDDVIFTIESIQNALYASPLAVNFSGVSMEKINDLTVKFILAEAYAPFLENLTVGIIPEHIWFEVKPENALLADYNLKPVGSGPYKFQELIKDKLGNIKTYSLLINNNYHDKKPYIEEVNFKFYANYESGVEALKNKNIDGLNFLPLELQVLLLTRGDLNYYNLQLPQYTAIFFNQDDRLFQRDTKLKEALAFAIDKAYIVNQVLLENGHIIQAPILEGYPGFNPEIEKREFDLEKAGELLDEAGYKISINQENNKSNNQDDDSISIDEESTNANVDEQSEGQEKKFEPLAPQYRMKGNDELEITITTVNNPENFKVAETIQKMWRELNIQVNLQIVDANKIQSEIIRPRNFQVLLFGEILGADPDLYAFWHSSQKGEAGLNLSNYRSTEADKVLEEARKISDPVERAKKYVHFQNILNRDIPAIFLYTPTYTYVLANKIKGFDLERIVVPSDRFSRIGNWYIKTRRGLK